MVHRLGETIRDLGNGADVANVGDIVMLEGFSGSRDLKHESALRGLRTF